MTSKRTALITGASGGIGLELAKLFAADGHDLVLVARSEAKLRALADELTAGNPAGNSASNPAIGVTVIAVDLARPAAPRELVAELETRGVELGYLVNNAGIGSNGKFWELEPERELEMIDLNVRALVELTRLVLPSMVARGFGRVLNIGSTAGFQAGPGMATYFASKAFVLHFTEAIAHELRGTGVTATVHCPGATATGFAKAANNHDTRLFASGVASADAVARDAYRAMHAGKTVRVHGLRNAVMAGSVRLAPRAWVTAIAARLNT
jgi:uncharacterized protein